MGKNRERLVMVEGDRVPHYRTHGDNYPVRAAIWLAKPGANADQIEDPSVTLVLMPDGSWLVRTRIGGRDETVAEGTLAKPE